MSTQPVAEVWLTDPAVEDLERLDGSVLVWALKKMVLLETNPHAGEPLLGSLIGYRKLTVGDRNWRIVWRVGDSPAGGTAIEIAEIWAVGARASSSVYAEMESRLADLPDSPTLRSLHAIVSELGKRAGGVVAHPPVPVAPAPEDWLVDRLVRTAGLSRADVEAMTSEQAVDAWTDYMVRRR